MIEEVRLSGTYKTLAEQQGVLSPAEERFERIRQTTRIFLGPIKVLIMLLLPLEANQQALIAVFSFTIVYWLSEAIPIPVTAVVALAWCVIPNVPGVGLNADDPPADILFGSFADDTFSCSPGLSSLPRLWSPTGWAGASPSASPRCRAWRVPRTALSSPLAR